MGLKPIVAPLFTIRPLKWDVPDPKAFDALLLTSANAAREGGGGLTPFAALPAYAVGEATGEAARAAGLNLVATGSADGADIVGRMAADGVRSALHLCGREHKPLDGPAIRILAVPVYAAEAVEALPAEAARALGEEAVALLHSPRAAERFGALVGERRYAIAIAAISAAAARSAGPGWATVEVARRPRDQALLEAAAKLCH